jgi:hypothetical protein
MYDCLFRHKQFVLKYCNKDVGLGVKQGKFYMLSLNDYALHVSNVSNDEKNRRVLALLQNYGTVVWTTCQGGRMERLIKNGVLLPFDFSDAG